MSALPVVKETLARDFRLLVISTTNFISFTIEFGFKFTEIFNFESRLS